jgi:hypothetical protein
MPRRKAFTLPLTPAEKQFLDRLHEIRRQALDDIGRGDYTLLEKMREDVRDIMKRKHDALSHPHTPDTKRRIGLATRARVGSQKRDHRGRCGGWRRGSS